MPSEVRRIFKLDAQKGGGEGGEGGSGTVKDKIRLGGEGGGCDVVGLQTGHSVGVGAVARDTTTINATQQTLNRSTKSLPLLEARRHGRVKACNVCY